MLKHDIEATLGVLTKGTGLTPLVYKVIMDKQALLEYLQSNQEPEQEVEKPSSLDLWFAELNMKEVRE